MPWATNGIVCYGVSLDRAVSWTRRVVGKATKFIGQANGGATMLTDEMPGSAEIAGRLADSAIGSNGKARLIEIDESGANRAVVNVGGIETVVMVDGNSGEEASGTITINSATAEHAVMGIEGGNASCTDCVEAR